MATVTLRPIANATPYDGTVVAIGKTVTVANQYTVVNDESDDSYLHIYYVQTAPWEFVSYQFTQTDLAGAITGVDIYLRGNKSYLGTCIIHYFNSTTEDDDQSTGTIAYETWRDAPGNWSNYKYTPTLTWTWAKVNGLRVGVSSVFASPDPDAFNFSEIWAVVTYDPPPAKPTGVTASDGTYMDKVALSWSAGSGGGPVTGYYVYRDGDLIKDTASTSYDDTGATPSIVHTYTVKAYGAGGESAASDGNTGYMERSNLFTFHG
jgi:hypothetical protein